MELCQWKEVPFGYVNVATERTRHCRGGFEHGAASESVSCVAPAAGLGVRSPRQARRYWALPHRVSDPKTPRKRCKRAAGGQRHGMGHRGLLCLIAVQVKPFRREAPRGGELRVAVHIAAKGRCFQRLQPTSTLRRRVHGQHAEGAPGLQASVSASKRATEGGGED